MDRYLNGVAPNNDERFSRQRRNLILYSMAVIFYEVANLNITGFNLISTSGTFNPSIINPFLHGTLFYFLWRYILAFSSIKTQKQIWATYKSNVTENISKKAANVFIKKYNAGKHIASNKDYLKIQENENNVSNINFWNNKSTYEIFYSPPDDGKQIIEDITIKSTSINIIKITTLIHSITLKNLFLEFYFPFTLFLVAICESLGWHITKPFLYALDF